MYTYNLNLLERDSEFKYYFLGFIAADGWISSKSNRIEITLNEKDVAILNLFRDMIVPGKKISHKLINGKHKARKLVIDNKAIKNEVMKYINTTNKTTSLIFPYGIPDQYIKDFIRGYIDGNGNLGVKQGRRKTKDGLKFYYGLRLRVLGTRAFLQGLLINIQRVLDKRINANPHKKGKENIYYLEFGFKSAQKIMEWLYKDPTYYLKRKYEVFQFITKSDSDTLSRNYNTDNGRYNMQSIS